MDKSAKNCPHLAPLIGECLAKETNPLRPEFDDSHIEAIDLGLPLVRLHDTYSHSIQRPFGHAINKQADKHNTQRLDFGDAGGDEGGIKWRNAWE